MSPSAAHTATVEIDGRRLKISNLDKPLYPAVGGHGPTTKAAVIDYYARVSAVLLPHLADRPVSRFRWPDGVTKDPFVEKAVPRGTPEWVRTVVVESPGSQRGHELVEYPLCDDLATLTWLANLAALEPARAAVGGRPARRRAQARPAGDRPRPGRTGRPARVRRGRAAGAGAAGRRRPRPAAGHQRQQGPAACTRPSRRSRTATTCGRTRRRSPSRSSATTATSWCRRCARRCGRARCCSTGARTTTRRRRSARTRCAGASSRTRRAPAPGPRSRTPGR
nr:hypothetical protein [Angustibacter aerolatus]